MNAGSRQAILTGSVCTVCSPVGPHRVTNGVLACIHAHIDTVSLFTHAHECYYTQCVASLPANTHRHLCNPDKHTQTYKVRRAEEKGSVLNTFLSRFRCWGNGAIMTRDERATMVSSLSLMFHCTVKKEASSVLIGPLGKTCRALYQEGSERVIDSEGGTERKHPVSAINEPHKPILLTHQQQLLMILMVQRQ